MTSAVPGKPPAVSGSPPSVPGKPPAVSGKPPAVSGSPPSADAGDAGADAVRRQIAAGIHRDHPRWVTIWVARTGRYRAWPLFRAPPGTDLTATTPEDLTAQIREIEQASRDPRARSPRAGAGG
jgi:hypothetical protein